MDNAQPDTIKKELKASKLTLTIGKENIEIETNKIAKQANGAVIVKHRESVILVAVTADFKEREGLDFFPLTVDYREKAAAGGSIPGAFNRRETRPSDHEILTSRIIDRSIRPLFSKDFKAETQVMITVLSADPDAEPGMLGVLGASAALMLSDIPWDGPVIGIRSAHIGDEHVILPTSKQLGDSKLTVTSSIGKNGIVMVEGGANESSEEHFIDALLKAQEVAAKPIKALIEWCNGLAKEKHSIASAEEKEDFRLKIASIVTPALNNVFGKSMPKAERKERIKKIVTDLNDTFDDDELIDDKLLRDTFESVYHHYVREMTIKRRKRLDGRDYDAIRNISGEVRWLPRCHGSALFTRGETQAIVTCSLGTAKDEQLIETLYGIEKKQFILHYNFPPYSVGEVRPNRGPGRREIGHGALAFRALEPVLPEHESFPYTIRVVSDITESNGSSSMATVCGGTLALIDAGVPLKKPVAGIAMGLIKEGEHIAILSDILGDEDHLGDMDFKVTGTEAGITAVQMDNKLGSLPREVMETALQQAKKGRLHILQEMKKMYGERQAELSPQAPRVLSLRIKKSKIGELIGPGGKTIQDIQARSNAKIEINDDGKVLIYATNLESAQLAYDFVNGLTEELEVGKIYEGTVVSIKNFGVFVRFRTNDEGLVHISEIAEERVENIDDYLKMDDVIPVKILGVDDKGRLKLSRKAALKNE